jgi:hypothetical protein
MAAAAPKYEGYSEQQDWTNPSTTKAPFRISSYYFNSPSLKPDEKLNPHFQSTNNPTKQKIPNSINEFGINIF